MIVKESKGHIPREDTLLHDEAKFLKLVNNIFKQDSHLPFIIFGGLFALTKETLLIRVRWKHAIDIIDDEFTEYYLTVSLSLMSRLMSTHERIVSRSCFKVIN